MTAIVGSLCCCNDKVYSCCTAWEPCPDTVKVSLTGINVVYEYTSCNAEESIDTECTGYLTGQQVVKTYTLSLSLVDMIYQKFADDSGPQTCYRYELVAPGTPEQTGVVTLSNTSDLLGYCYEDPVGFENQPCDLVHCTTSKTIPGLPMDGSDADFIVQNVTIAHMRTQTEGGFPGTNCRAALSIALQIDYNSHNSHEYFPSSGETDNCGEIIETGEVFSFLVQLEVSSNAWDVGDSVCPQNLTWTIDFIQIDFLDWGDGGNYSFTQTPHACESASSCPGSVGPCFDADEITGCGADNVWPNTFREITGNPRGTITVTA